jgi:hypothetical protein
MDAITAVIIIGAVVVFLWFIYSVGSGFNNTLQTLNPVNWFKGFSLPNLFNVQAGSAQDTMTPAKMEALQQSEHQGMMDWLSKYWVNNEQRVQSYMALQTDQIKLHPDIYNQVLSTSETTHKAEIDAMSADTLNQILSNQQDLEQKINAANAAAAQPNPVYAAAQKLTAQQNYGVSQQTQELIQKAAEQTTPDSGQVIKTPTGIYMT